MSKKEDYIKNAAQKFGWTQADVRRAVDAYGEVNTEEEVIACCIHYAGPELKKRNYELGARKRVNANQKVMIENLVSQLTTVQDFYQNQLVPNLRATIDSQAEYITDLLKKMPWASGGDK